MGNYLIAGGSRGIGLELVGRLAPAAERIDVWSRSLDDLTPDATVAHTSVDFTDPAWAAPDLPESLQGAVYCPGTVNLKSFRALSEDDFRRDWEVNLLGAVRFLKACGPRLTGTEGRPASVVLFSTVAVGQGMPMHASVAAAKGAVEGLVRTLAAEWAPKVRVNAVVAGMVATEQAELFYGGSESQAAVCATIPLGRLAQPTEIGWAAAFLASDAASYISGACLEVHGGGEPPPYLSASTANTR